MILPERVENIVYQTTDNRVFQVLDQQKYFHRLIQASEIYKLASERKYFLQGDRKCLKIRPSRRWPVHLRR